MFMALHDDRRRLPVVLLSGFLGSGKTTLVNRLLGDARLADTAVAINEFGETPLDHQLIAGDEDRTVVIANGCLCCNVSGDLEDAVMRIFSRRQAGDLPRFARLIVEPSGLADPAPIAQAILRNPVMARALRLEAVVATVDSLLAEAQIARHPETRKQISLADHLVLTKTDLVDGAQIARVEALLRALNPLAPIHRADAVAADPGLVLPASFLDLEAPPSHPIARRSALIAESIEIAQHGEPVAALTLSAEAPLDWRAFDAWLRDLRVAHAEEILRLKGLLNVAEARGPLLLQGVHHVLHPPVELAAWPDADHRTRLILIVQGLDPDRLAADWKNALPRLLAIPAAA